MWRQIPHTVQCATSVCGSRAERFLADLSPENRCGSLKHSPYPEAERERKNTQKNRVYHRPNAQLRHPVGVRSFTASPPREVQFRHFASKQHPCAPSIQTDQYQQYADCKQKRHGNCSFCYSHAQKSMDRELCDLNLQVGVPLSNAALAVFLLSQ